MTHTVLWITSKWILPADDGSRLATASLLRGVANRGVTIDLMALHGPNERPSSVDAVRELGIRAAFGVRRTKGNDTGVAKALRLGTALLSSPLIPVTAAPYFEPSLTRAVEERLADGYSHIVFEGLHPAGIFSPHGVFRRREGLPRLIYRAQNCETTIWERTAELSSSIPKRALLRYQTARMRVFERSLIDGVDGVAAISHEDAVAFEAMTPRATPKCSVIPIGFDFSAPFPPPASETGLKLLFLGRLDWPPNRDGLRWFLREVWPGVVAERPEMLLSVAGSGDGRWLTDFEGTPNMRFLGRVPDVEPLYREHHASLVPIFYGSGTRVKALEAARYGRSCISTPLGVEGTGFRAGIEYLTADTVSEWRAMLRTIDGTALAQTGLAAHTLAEQSFSSAAVASRFVDLLDRTARESGLSR